LPSRVKQPHKPLLVKECGFPTGEKRNFKKCPTAQEDIENEDINERKIKARPHNNLGIKAQLSPEKRQ
jgi:hypothetical protein